MTAEQWADALMREHSSTERTFRENLVRTIKEAVRDQRTACANSLDDCYQILNEEPPRTALIAFSEARRRVLAAEVKP